TMRSANRALADTRKHPRRGADSRRVCSRRSRHGSSGTASRAAANGSPERRSRWHVEPLRLDALLISVLALRERVDDPEPAIVRTALLAVRHVLAVDDDVRRREHAVAGDQVVRPLHLRMHAERAERLAERLRIDAEAREELRELLLGVEHVAFHMDLVEERLMHLVELAQSLGRVVRARMELRETAPRCRDPDEIDVIRLLSLPLLEERLEPEARGAAVLEDLRDLDHAGFGARRLGRIDRPVV